MFNIEKYGLSKLGAPRCAPAGAFFPSKIKGSVFLIRRILAFYVFNIEDIAFISLVLLGALPQGLFPSKIKGPLFLIHRSFIPDT